MANNTPPPAVPAPASRPECQCPICGRLHYKLAENPPAAIVGKVLFPEAVTLPPSAPASRSGEDHATLIERCKRLSTDPLRLDSYGGYPAGHAVWAGQAASALIEAANALTIPVSRDSGEAAKLARELDICDPLNQRAKIWELKHKAVKALLSLSASAARLTEDNKRLREALEAMVNRWEPDCGGSDRRMWEAAMEALGHEFSPTASPPERCPKPQPRCGGKGWIGWLYAPKNVIDCPGCPDCAGTGQRKNDDARIQT